MILFPRKFLFQHYFHPIILLKQSFSYKIWNKTIDTKFEISFKMAQKKIMTFVLFTSFISVRQKSKSYVPKSVKMY